MSIEEIKATVDDLGQAWDKFKARHDEVGTKQDDELERLGGELDKLQGRLDNLNSAVANGGAGGAAPWQEGPEGKAFLSFARKGLDGMDPDERKVLTEGDDTGGGYLAPDDFVTEIIKDTVEFSPLRSIARVRQTGRSVVQVPKRTGVLTAVWADEQELTNETTGLAYGREDLPVSKLKARVDITIEDLEDSAFNIEAELRSEFAEQFGVAEGLAFISGNGVKRPEGILSNSNITSVNSGHASLVQADGLIDLWSDLKSVYASQGRWLFNRKTLGAIRKLKDGNGQYLWIPGLAGGAPATVLDLPYVEMPDMPDIAVDAFPIAFGDFRRGYLIVDRVTITIQRDPFTSGANDIVIFRARKRVGGQVVLPEAIRLQKIST